MAYFRNSYRYIWKNTEDIKDLLLYQNAALPVDISFTTPTLFCQGSFGNGWVDLFEMNVKTTIYREETKKKEYLETGMYHYEPIENTKQVFATFNSGATNIVDADNEVYYARR